MKNCNLLNRIIAPVVENRRNFANESAENLGTKLLHGHVSTIATPAIARRNQTDGTNGTPLKESFFHEHSPARGVPAPTELVFPLNRFL